MADPKPTATSTGAANPKATAPATTATTAADTTTTTTTTATEEAEVGVAAVEVEVEDADAPKTYYLKPGFHHGIIERGETKTVDRAGTPVELFPAQYKSFQDKFWTAKEYEAAKESGSLADGPTAADTLLHSPKVPEDGDASEDSTGKEGNKDNKDNKE